MRNEFTALIEEGENGYWIATSPEVPSAVGQGSSPEEARSDLATCIEFVLQYQRDEALERAAPGVIHEVVTVG